MVRPGTADELENYLGCQVLGRGFAHMVCKDCGKSELLAFCCRGRGFCPCCTGRRMAQTAANLTEFVLPGGIQRFYQRRLAELGHPGGRTGSVTAIQRASSDLRLNPHLHGVFLDGVFVEQASGELSFVELPELSDLDVCEPLQSLSARVLEPLRRQGLLSDDHDAALGAQDADGEQLVLSALAAAASFGTHLAGPESRPGRVPSLHESGAQPRAQAPLCAAYGGFSLHANTTVATGHKPGRERLIKYILRPSLAAERLERLDDQEGGRVRLRLERPFSDGTWAVEMDELSLVARLLACTPRWCHRPGKTRSKPAPARGPPYYRGRVRRIRHGGAQQDLLS